MSDCSKNRNPLIRNGTNQVQRFNHALDEMFVRPDENKMENWLVYARELGSHIRYYSPDNTSSGDWQPFFDTDVSAQLALIAVQDVDDFKDRIRILLKKLLSTELQGDPTAVRKTFGLLFSGTLTLTYRLDYFAEILPDDITLKRTLHNLALTKLGSALKRLLSYYKAAAEFYLPSLVEDQTVPNWTILSFKQEKLSQIVGKVRNKLSERWIFKGASTTFSDYYNAEIIADRTIYDHPAAAVADADLWEVINHAANHNLFTSLFAEFLAAYSKVVGDARAQLLDTITKQNTHDPYYALYLTFLHLFKYAQADINKFTSRHFDFYYRDVLRLNPKKSQPNHVHLILELATQVNEFRIAKNTSFKAGKDSLGKEVLYRSDNDVILNKSQVAELRTFYKAGSLDKIGPQSLQGFLFASPVAASSDGQGGKLISETKDWHPFANKIYGDGKLIDISMPEGLIGFGLASHYLFLNEGQRSVTVLLKGQGLNKLSNGMFLCAYTGEKGWIDKGCSVSVLSATQATLTIPIDAADPPVVAYNTKVHLGNYNAVDTPVLRFLLKNVKGQDYLEALREVRLSGIKLTVRAGGLDFYNTSGLKDLLISTDQGQVDPSKPYLPFGQQPKAGAGLVIGNREIFSKKGAKISLAISWAELSESIQDMDYNVTDIFFPTAQYKFLENGVWQDANFKSTLNSEHVGAAKNGEVELFWGKDSVMIPEVYLPSSAVTIPDAASIDYREEYTPYNIASRSGFLKLQLNHDFQFDKYFLALQLYMIGVANEKIDPAATAPPKEPYTPKIQSVYMSYEASSEVSFAAINNAAVRLFHYYPFGYEKLSSDDVIGSSVFLLPRFTHSEGFSLAHNQAEFYIGLNDVVTPQKVELLFKVLDGSTDPLKSKPDRHVFWSYLNQNKWIDFTENEINDGTRQLIETGIISFPLPDEATKDNTILPAGLHWLRASIKEMPEQVCRLIDVKAQAIRATFFDQDNAEDFLKEALPANSISRLKEPEASVKKVEQPYSSFGGRYKEDNRSFTVRVSERLRHKNRAITIRDYEQLVLEGFPDIHKVKCLNHTRLELKENSTVYNEQAAGHVTVITIPDLRKRNAINPLRPYTSRDRLEQIKEFIISRSNCNVSLYVENPAFEELRVETKIILKDAFAGNDGFYSKQLKQDIVAFLTPWAYNLAAEINFGGRINKSQLINFIEERDYIDFILDLKMFHNKMDGTSEGPDQEEIVASTGRSILVSAPAAGHVVTIVPAPKKVEDHDCGE